MRDRPRHPGVVHAALTLALVLVLAFVALTTNQPPPPTIAEFAPQSVENITDAPADQSSKSGRGGGDCVVGLGGVCEGGGRRVEEAVPSPGIQVARVRRCVGDPPRQIEDPQSPPCVPYWSGDNGGSTYKGVTRDEIRVVVADGITGDHIAYANFFNARFEFYGRKILLLDAAGPTSGGPAQQRAMATGADEERKAFAAMDYGGFDQGFYFYEELARRGLIGVVTDPDATEELLAKNHPYLWSYPLGNDKIFASLGNWACSRLVGRPASHGGTPTGIRRFGAILVRSWDGATERTDPLLEQLAACGVRDVPTVEFTDASCDTAACADSGSGSSVDATNAILKLRQAGVTTVFCLCRVSSVGQVFRAANGQSYFPEWLVSTYWYMDSVFAVRSWPATAYVPEQLRNAFGTSFYPMQLAVPDQDQYWAAREMGGGSAVATENAAISSVRWMQYKALLLLASGIQLAGPNLTPQTFAAGLQRTAFPNPQHPNMEGRVGFSGDHTMIDDGAEIWWSNTASGPYDDVQGGAYCYVDRGERYPRMRWPGGDVFFAGECYPGGARR